MEKLDTFIRAATENFTWYQSAEGGPYSWRTLVFSCEREELERVALDALANGVPECKISKTPYKKSRIYNSTHFHPSLSEALAFRHKWIDDPTLAVAGPIPIARQFLQEERGFKNLATILEALDGRGLIVGEPPNSATPKS